MAAILYGGLRATARSHGSISLLLSWRAKRSNLQSLTSARDRRLPTSTRDWTDGPRPAIRNLRLPARGPRLPGSREASSHPDLGAVRDPSSERSPTVLGAGGAGIVESLWDE